MDGKNTLLKQLGNKINKEYTDYINSLYDLDAEEIIECSYKTVMLKSFKNIISYDSDAHLDEWQIAKLLKVENLLELLYADWLKYDDSEYAILGEFVFGYWDWNYFNRAERKTAVEVALIYVNIPKTKKESFILEGLRQKEKEK